VNEVGYFRSGENELYYSADIPSETSGGAGIVFVHAADGNRLGPHRMFVELARKFNGLGYATLRFDLSGCGDSSGSTSNGGVEAEVFDVVSAVKFLKAGAELDEVILFGISRGARLCYRAMAEHELPLEGVILLSAPVPGGKAGLSSFAGQLKQYLYKLKEPSYARKLISGRANIGGVHRTLMTALRLGGRYKPIEGVAFATIAPILFIYASHDPIAEASSLYYKGACERSQVRFDCRFIDGANHSFFHYKWKEQIFDLSTQWLKSVSRQAVS